MKNSCKIAALALALCGIAASAMAQGSGAQVVLSNIVEEQETIAAGQRKLGRLVGVSRFQAPVLLPVRPQPNFLYLGFFGGATVEYWPHGSVQDGTQRHHVLSGQAVTLGLVGNPSINLTSPSVCPIQPVSLSNPCIIKLTWLRGRSRR